MSASVHVAAVDCGTNSIRLLICEVDPHSGAIVHEVCRENTIVRLGEGVDATGKFSDAAVQRVRAALTTYVEEMKRHDVKAVRMVATSATRDASNRDEFFSMTESLLGQIQPGASAEVIEGAEEAQLSFDGATLDLNSDSDEIVCVIDLGGGSTEFVMGECASRTGNSGAEDSAPTMHGSISTQMGCVRLTERFLHSDPPVDSEILAARGFVRTRLDEVQDQLNVSATTKLVGCAGTMTTLSALVQDLPDYDPALIHMSELDFSDVSSMTSQLLSETVDERIARPQVLEGRADVIGGGAIVVQEIIHLFSERAGADSIIISEKDILDGIIAGLARSLN